MKPRYDEPGIIAETPAEHQLCYDGAEYFRRYYWEHLDEVAPVDSSITLSRAAVPGALVLNADQTLLVIAGLSRHTEEESESLASEPLTFLPQKALQEVFLAFADKVRRRHCFANKPISTRCGRVLIEKHFETSKQHSRRSA